MLISQKLGGRVNLKIGVQGAIYNIQLKLGGVQKGEPTMFRTLPTTQPQPLDRFWQIRYKYSTVRKY